MAQTKTDKVGRGKRKQVKAAPKKRLPSVSLIVTARGKEPLLRQTIEHAIKEAGRKIEVILVDNGLETVPELPKTVKIITEHELLGVGIARDVGIEQATGSVIVLIDAHVRLDADWAVHVGECYGRPEWARSVGCGTVGGLNADFTIDEGQPIRTGAALTWLHTANGGDRRPLVGIWADQKAGERCASIMGAYYTIARQWYYDIGRPLALLRAWGCDEEILTLASYLSGGDCRMLPAECRGWHWYSRPEGAVPYSTEELRQVRNVRAMIPMLFPFTAEERDVMRDHMDRHRMPEFETAEQRAFARRYVAKRAELERYLREWCPTWVEWRNGQPRQRPQPLKPMKHDRCDQCDAYGSFRVTYTRGNITRYRCNRCGRAAWRFNDLERLNYGHLND